MTEFADKTTLYGYWTNNEPTKVVVEDVSGRKAFELHKEGTSVPFDADDPDHAGLLQKAHKAKVWNARVLC